MNGTGAGVMGADDAMPAGEQAQPIAGTGPAALAVTGGNVIELASLGGTLLAGGLARLHIRRKKIRFDAS